MASYLNGGAGIRTLETLAGLPVFKTGAIDHSATPPAAEGKTNAGVWFRQNATPRARSTPWAKMRGVTTNATFKLERPDPSEKGFVRFYAPAAVKSDCALTTKVGGDSLFGLGGSRVVYSSRRRVL